MNMMIGFFGLSSWLFWVCQVSLFPLIPSKPLLFHSSLPLCSVKSIFNGKWKYHYVGSSVTDNAKNVISNNTLDTYVNESYALCPHTLHRVRTEMFIGHQLAYACKQQDVQAIWVPHGCRIMSPHQAILHIVNSRDKMYSATARAVSSSSIMAAAASQRRLNSELVSGSYQHHDIKHADVAKRRDLNYHSSIIPTGQPKINITVVGDSISAQAYIAGCCSLEARNLLDFVDIKYNLELLYRRDMPCVDNCTIEGEEGVRFRQAAAKKAFGNSCEACKDGVRHYPNETEFNSQWMRIVPNNTNILIMGGGTWYSYYSGIMNSTIRYEETLRLFVAPSLGAFIKRTGVKVFWVDLPPVAEDVGDERAASMKQMNATNTTSYSYLCNNASKYNASHSIGGDETNSFSCNSTVQKPVYNKAYEWASFETKNAIAKSILEPVGVIFVESWHALHPRKIAHSSISKDGLHWCNPGRHTVPEFLFHVIFHLAALQYD